MQRRRSLQTRAKVSFLNTFHNNVFQERNFFSQCIPSKTSQNSSSGEWFVSTQGRKREIGNLLARERAKNYRTYENQFIERNNQLVWLPLFNKYSRSTVQNLFTFLEKAIRFYPIHCLCCYLARRQSKPTTVSR